MMNEEEKEIINESAEENHEQDTATGESGQGVETDNSGENKDARLQNELAEARDKYLRLYSEFENFRRRTAKEKIELIDSANERLIIALLPISDDFERAERALLDKQAEDAQGFSLIHNKFRKVLESYGVKAMEIGVGSDFDPDSHEAVTQLPAQTEELKGKIVDVLEKGYTLNNKVIRYAKVVIGS